MGQKDRKHKKKMCDTIRAQTSKTQKQKAPSQMRKKKNVRTYMCIWKKKKGGVKKKKTAFNTW